MWPVCVRARARMCVDTACKCTGTMDLAWDMWERLQEDESLSPADAKLLNETIVQSTL